MVNPIKNPLFLKLIKVFSIVFPSAVAGLVLMNWIAVVQLHYNPDIFPKVAALVVGVPLSYFFLRPLIRQLDYGDGKGPFFLSYILLPAVLMVTTDMYITYFFNCTFSIITVEHPSDILNFPKEKFFFIKQQKVLAGNYTIVKNARSQKGCVIHTAYFIAPMYDSFFTNSEPPVSKIGYGTLYREKIGDKNPIFYRERVTDFYDQSEIDYNLNEHKEFDYFEKLENSDDRDQYIEAWNINAHLDRTNKPLILVKGDGTLYDRKKQELMEFLLSFSISYVVTILLFFFSDIMDQYGFRD